MKAGIIGYPLTGKRTLFNLISGSDIKTGIFTEIETEKSFSKEAFQDLAYQLLSKLSEQ